MYVYNKYKYFYAQSYYKYIVLHYLFIQTKKKEIGSLRKNGHLFLSIFRNLDGEFYFFIEKSILLENALKTKSMFFY